MPQPKETGLGAPRHSWEVGVHQGILDFRLQTLIPPLLPGPGWRTEAERECLKVPLVPCFVLG